VRGHPPHLESPRGEGARRERDREFLEEEEGHHNIQREREPDREGEMSE
jgi:hypothetical protein